MEINFSVAKKKVSRKISIEQNLKQHVLSHLEKPHSKSPELHSKPSPQIRSRNAKSKTTVPVNIKPKTEAEVDKRKKEQPNQELKESTQSLDLVEFDSVEESTNNRTFMNKILIPELLTQRTNDGKPSQEENKGENDEEDELLSVSRFDRIFDQSST